MKTTLVIAPTMRAAQFYCNAMGIQNGRPYAPNIKTIRGLDPEYFDVLIVNAQLSDAPTDFSEEFLEALKAEESRGLDVTWFGFGVLYE